MTIATSDEQIAVCDAIAEWAGRVRATELVRADIDKPRDQWTGLLDQLAEFGIVAAALPESAGGLGATFTDVAAMIERCGVDLVPGPIGATVTAALGLSRSTDPRAGDLVAALGEGRLSASVPTSATSGAPTIRLDGGTLDLGLVPGHVDGGSILARLTVDGTSGWWLVPPGVGAHDLAPIAPADGRMSVSRVRIGGLTPADLIELPDADLVEGTLSATTAAYASGVTRWALTTAVDYAKVRTQFGSPIGAFQAVKHICAEMLCRSEQVTAAAWDLARAVDDLLGGADDAADQLRLSRLAADVLVADLAVATAKDCIQVLGGIGFTFEHDAHLYLRAAMAIRSTLGYGTAQGADLGRLGLAGARRRFEVDLSEVEDRRAEVRATAESIAATAESDRRAALADTGYLTPHWPAPYGLGASPVEQLLIDSELQRADVTRPDLVIGAWAIPTILEHGTDAQRERFVGPTLVGDIVWCQLFSEPEAGSDLAALRTRATRVDGGWQLSGQKIWTSQAHNAHWGICLARTNPDAAKHKGITYFVVDMTSPGIDIRPLRELTGRANFNEVFFDDVFVPDENVVGEVDGGWRLARTTLANERVAMGGSSLGKEMEDLLGQVGRSEIPVAEHDLGRIGRLVADAHIGRVIDTRMVVQRLAGHDPGALANVRKLIGVAHRQSVPDLALELLGADGLATPEAFDADLQNRCLSIAGGTTQILRTAAAERILGLPRS
ncbi:acyl-CoA dehydrogenase [Gordonia soli]|uniref:Putative acyl-CoA dehydrogenase n=1 Tax=Gordonia soli NBRC 108243 TaxID=1223545 RepID=M0QPD9_9ACTN|nr:acyl-CoA dehydrogenase [Gordonia soli]GAC70530.1 putative acyl-CoA dehydrogenase [Gordonia soli NBRC 108243]